MAERHQGQKNKRDSLEHVSLTPEMIRRIPHIGSRKTSVSTPAYTSGSWLADKVLEGVHRAPSRTHLSTCYLTPPLPALGFACCHNCSVFRSATRAGRPADTSKHRKPGAIGP